MYIIINQFLINFALGGFLGVVISVIVDRRFTTPLWWITILIIVGLAAVNNLYQLGTH